MESDISPRKNSTKKILILARLIPLPSPSHAEVKIAQKDCYCGIVINFSKGTPYVRKVVALN